jgi:(2Fe-2S) ferredoxin
VTRRHLFVCTNDRSSGKPACGARGGRELLAAVQNLLIARGGDALATGCECLGPCFDGPNAVVYPDGVWYGGLDAGDAPALVEHLVAGAVGPKRIDAPGSDD